MNSRRVKRLYSRRQPSRIVCPMLASSYGGSARFGRGESENNILISSVNRTRHWCCFHFTSSWHQRDNVYVADHLLSDITLTRLTLIGGRRARVCGYGDVAEGAAPNSALQQEAVRLFCQTLDAFQSYLSEGCGDVLALRPRPFIRLPMDSCVTRT